MGLVIAANARLAQSAHPEMRLARPTSIRQDHAAQPVKSDSIPCVAATLLRDQPVAWQQNGRPAKAHIYEGPATEIGDSGRAARARSR